MRAGDLDPLPDAVAQLVAAAAADAELGILGEVREQPGVVVRLERGVRVDLDEDVDRDVERGQAAPEREQVAAAAAALGELVGAFAGPDEMIQS